MEHAQGAVAGSRARQLERQVEGRLEVGGRDPSSRQQQRDGMGPIAAAPVTPTATLNGDDATISWTAPGGTSVARYIVWRDGIPAVVLPAGTTSWVDYDLPARSHTRYHLSLLNTSGAESGAVAAAPGYLWVP